LSDRDEPTEIDEEWQARVHPRLQSWLHRLRAVELAYQQRVATFLEYCRAAMPRPAVSELLDEHSNQRLERTWGAVAEYFQSTMPENLLARDTAEFYIDCGSEMGWWTGGDEERGLVLADVAAECLRTAGEFSDDAAVRVGPFLVQALSDGDAPLPGFHFLFERVDVAVWRWLSPEANLDENDAELEWAGADEVLSLYEHAPSAFAELQLSANSSIPDTAPAQMHELVEMIRACGISDRGVMRAIGPALTIPMCRAFEHGDGLQVQRCIDALGALKSELRLQDLK
jgi:hypothetical protein